MFIEVDFGQDGMRLVNLNLVTNIESNADGFAIFHFLDNVSLVSLVSFEDVKHQMKELLCR